MGSSPRATRGIYSAGLAARVSRSLALLGLPERTNSRSRSVPKFYLTTAIDYSNGDPHLGHALEKVGADCIARYRRLRGDDVHFLMGMDEHSQAVLQAAARAEVPPQEWVDRMASRFAEFWARLECSH